MSEHINKVILLGLLGKDPEFKTPEKSNRFTLLSVATTEKWTDKSTGEKKENTEWHKVVVFDEALSQYAAENLKKGDKVRVEGKLNTSKWEKDGVTRYSTKVIVNKFSGKLLLEYNDTPENMIPIKEVESVYADSIPF